MVFQRIKSAGWSQRKKLKSTEITQLDIDHANAIDKTGETMASSGGVSGQIDWKSTSSNNFLAGHVSTFNVNSTLTVDGYYTVNGVNGTIILGNGNTLSTSGTGTITSGTAGSIILAGGSTDYPKFNANRSRNILVPCSAAANVTQNLGNIATTTTGVTLLFSIQGRAHQGSTLSSVVLTFAVGTSHSGVPANLPTLAVYRVTQGGSSANLGSPVSPPTPGSGAAWYAGGATQTLTYTPSTNNVIDVGTYYYYVQIVDESGTNSLSGNLFYNVSLTFSAIADMRFA